MKIFKCVFIVFVLLLTQLSSAQSELLDNPGFETWSSNVLGNTAVDWTFPLGGAKPETVDKVQGNYAFSTNELTQASNVLQQEVSTQSFIPGQTYQVQIKYKVLTSKDGGEVKLDCFWNSARDGELTHDSEKLKTSYFTGTDWTTKTVTTTVPTATSTMLSFYFRVVVPKGAKVLFDDFSFKLTQDPLVPVLFVLPSTVPAVSTTLNVSKEFAPVSIQQYNLLKPVTVSITGAGAHQFSANVSSTVLPKQEVKFTYLATQIGTHAAMVTIESEGNELLTQTIRLQGSCTNPEATPVISIDPKEVPAFSAVVGGSDSVFTVQLSSENLNDWLYAQVTHKKGNAFSVNNTMFMKNTSVPLKITFRPASEGEFESQIRLYSVGAPDVTISLSGVGKLKSDGNESYLTEFDLSNANPLVLLNEGFDNVQHNKQLNTTDARWNNVVKSGSRPWWGFEHKSSTNTVIERSAKATAYVYQQENNDPWEMWLVTPPLDYKSAQSKMFTFRVMGDLMLENGTTKLDLYYIDKLEGQELYFGSVDGVPIPTIPDENGSWSELHLDLTGQNISDVFFMGFKFKGNSGSSAPTTYYIDDVTWGRTDIPKIKADSSMVRMIAPLNVEIQSTITVSTENGQQPVSISVAGANASKFALSTKTLPATGGTFRLGFKSDIVGVHEAYVKLSSQGAADVRIPVSVLNRSTSDLNVSKAEEVKVWIQDEQMYIQANEFKSMMLFSVHGVCVGESDRPEYNTKQLGKGVYVVKVTTSNGVRTKSVVVY